jgi:hypothetical protein
MSAPTTIKARDIKTGDRVVIKGREDRTKSFEVANVASFDTNVSVTVKQGRGAWTTWNFKPDQDVNVRRA